MRPGYFEPGTAISFCAADCAEGGCCARTGPGTVVMVAAMIAIVAGRQNCMHRPRVFCSRGENDSNFRATRTVSGDFPWLSGKGRRRGTAAAQAKAELGENQQAPVGKLQAPERREQLTPLVEIARQNSDQLMACIEQIER
jgi:hypothetical protein